MYACPRCNACAPPNLRRANAVNLVKALVAAVVIIIALPDAKSRLFASMSSADESKSSDRVWNAYVTPGVLAVVALAVVLLTFNTVKKPLKKAHQARKGKLGSQPTEPSRAPQAAIRRPSRDSAAAPIEAPEPSCEKGTGLVGGREHHAADSESDPELAAGVGTFKDCVLSRTIARRGGNAPQPSELPSNAAGQNLQLADRDAAVCTGSSSCQSHCRCQCRPKRDSSGGDDSAEGDGFGVPLEREALSAGSDLSACTRDRAHLSGVPATLALPTGPTPPDARATLPAEPGSDPRSSVASIGRSAPAPQATLEVVWNDDAKMAHLAFRTESPRNGGARPRPSPACAPAALHVSWDAAAQSAGLSLRTGSESIRTRSPSPSRESEEMIWM
jgi:hypothetical protein